MVWIWRIGSAKTAYVAVMGFTGVAGNVWKTIDAGTTWTDFTGIGNGALPDSPVNAVVILWRGLPDPSAKRHGTVVGYTVTNRIVPRYYH